MVPDNSLIDFILQVLLPIIGGLAVLWMLLAWLFRRWEARLVGRRSSSLSFPLSPLAFLGRRLMVEGLLNDPVVQSAITTRAREEGVSEDEVERRARKYIREIVPAFKAVFYFSIGYFLARLLLLAMYRVRAIENPERHTAVARDATVVLVMNHRSSMDVLLVNYLLSRDSTVAHSAGEWARLWPFYHLMRMAGNYVIDRESGDPLYRIVLKRFVQMAVTHGIHLGVFPEGSLTRDGHLQELHFGLLNYITLASWPGQDRDVVFLPVGFNFDEVPEQESLVFGASSEFRKRGKPYLAFASIRFALGLLMLPLRSRDSRNGWACARFGEPVSLKKWQGARGIQLKTLTSEQRRFHIDALGRQLMESATRWITVLPINLVAAILVEEPERAWDESDLVDRAVELGNGLEGSGTPLFSYGEDLREGCQMALARLDLRENIVRGPDGTIGINQARLPMLAYYANTISHFQEPGNSVSHPGARPMEQLTASERDRHYLAAVSASYDRVRDHSIDGVGFFARFYHQFQASSPAVREKFANTDMAMQQVHLRSSLEHVQDYFIRGEPSELLRQIAASHGVSGKDIAPSLYDLWLESLMVALEEYDTGFDPGLAIAWRAVMAPGIEYMRSQYEAEPRAAQLAGRQDTMIAGEDGIARWIDHWAGRTPDRQALWSDASAMTYGELAEASVRLASALEGECGVSPGDRVGFLGHNRVEFIVLTFACARLGAMLVPINWRLAAAEQRRFLERASVKVLFAERGFGEAAESVDGGWEVLWLNGTTGSTGQRTYADLLRSGTGEVPAHGNMDSPLFMVFTSGSSGDPKGVVLHQGAVHWNALNSRAMHDMRRSDHVLTTLPFFHVGGINIQTLPALQVGATVSILPGFDAGEFVEFVERRQPTLTVLVPAQMQALMQLKGWEDADMDSLRTVSTGSTIVDKGLIRAWANKGVPVIQIYGCTESCPVAVHQTVEGIGPGLGTVGHPALYTDLRIVDGNGEVVGSGVEGEILLRGPNIMREYWQDAEATAETFQHGWLKTGDLGYVDPDGRLHVVGRKKRLIISGGENIHPAEVEQVLENCEGILEAAVIGASDKRWGEVPVAVVATGGTATISEDDIRLHLDSNLGRYKHPRQIFLVESLPHTGLDKIAYPEVAEYVAARLTAVD